MKECILCHKQVEDLNDNLSSRKVVTMKWDTLSIR